MKLSDTILLFAVLSFSASLARGIAPQGSQQSTPTVESAKPFDVPTFPNVACPIMGKPASTKLFAETDFGRIYICCKGCVKDIQADLPTAYRTAYPKDVKVENKLSPLSGRTIEPGAPTLTLQGYTFFVANEKEVLEARRHSQLALAKLRDPKLVDLANALCPVAATPVAANQLVVIEGHIVHLSGPKVLEQVAKDPRAALEQAKKIARAGARPAEPK